MIKSHHQQDCVNMSRTRKTTKKNITADWERPESLSPNEEVRTVKEF